MHVEPGRAQESLSDLDRVFDRTRLASRSVTTGFPLLGWGLAWVVGFAGVELVSGPARIAVAAAAWLTGMLLSWLPIRAAIRPGTQRPMRRAWFVVLLASPFLVTASGPSSWAHVMLLLGGLWGLAMCLYAVVTADLAFAVVAGIAVAGAGMVVVAGLVHPLLVYGLVAGLPMAALGLVRVRQGAGIG